MKVQVRVFLKDSILDPQGKTVEQALKGMDFQVSNVRMGKLISLEVPTDDKAEAKRLASQMADKLLANPVIESYSVQFD